MTRMLYLIIVVAFLDTFIQLPIITPYSQELGASYALTGAIVEVYSLTNMVGNVLGGHWIDKYGSNIMLLSGESLVRAFYILEVFGVICLTLFIICFYQLSVTVLQLFKALFFHGLAGSLLIPASFAYVGDNSKPETRGKTMAFTGAGIGIAAIAGPAIGGAMAARSSIPNVFL